jgi:superfamily II DNA or RNA helicase
MWQKRFVNSFDAWVEQTFLLVALPGGGKTIAALYASKEWLSNAIGKNRFIIVIVPSRNLKRQWKKKAKKLFGFELQSKEFTGDLKKGMHGYVATYSAVVTESLLLRRLCAKHEIMVIFDEVHHIGESASWGVAVQEAFEGATKRLAMSGTPWRSDGGQIPFLRVNPETGEYEHQERFDWPAALTDAHPLTGELCPSVRMLSFRPYHGSAEFENDGQVVGLNSEDTLSDEDVARCLRGRVIDERWATLLLSEAHARLMELREQKPDAAGIVVCVDIEHAQRVAKWLKNITGETPVIAVSDDEVAPGEPVDTFGADGATSKWIVSVRQVSEGVDIPRLIVGVYLTNYTTELFFRQFIGRIARNQNTEADKEAYVFYPHHPRLNEYAEKIQELQALAIAKRQKEERDGDGGGRGPGTYIYLGASEARSAGMILPGLIREAACGPIEARTISEFSKKYGIPETIAARIIRDRGWRPEPSNENDSDPETDREPLEDRLEYMRRRQNKRVGYLAVLIGADHKELNAQANKHVGCASVDVATEEQLKCRAIYIEQRIREAKSAA